MDNKIRLEPCHYVFDATAVAQIESLPAPMQNPFSPWLEQAKVRLAAEKAVAALEGEILPPLGAAGEATPPRL